MEPLLLDAWATGGVFGEEVGEVAGGGWDRGLDIRQRDAHRLLLGHTPGCAAMHRDSCDCVRCSAVDLWMLAVNAAVGAVRNVTAQRKVAKRAAATSAHGHNASADARLECDGDGRLN